VKKLERGVLLVVSSPSGAGKTTLVRRLMQEYPRLGFSVSYTTRPPRANEIDGVDYHFVDDARFDAMVDAEQFAEWALVHGRRYGTAQQTIVDNIEAGRDVVFDIDYQGGTTLKGKFENDAVMVFVLPPSMKELERRLRRRGTDAEEMVVRRLAKAKEELGHYDAYDYLVINEDLDKAYADLRAIYAAAHCSRRRRARWALALLEEARGDES
jgi:guanylate kinase